MGLVFVCLAVGRVVWLKPLMNYWYLEIETELQLHVFCVKTLSCFVVGFVNFMGLLVCFLCSVFVKFMGIITFFEFNLRIIQGPSAYCVV